MPAYYNYAMPYGLPISYYTGVGGPVCYLPSDGCDNNHRVGLIGIATPNEPIGFSFERASSAAPLKIAFGAAPAAWRCSPQRLVAG
jgi:hypothetical protein